MPVAQAIDSDSDDQPTDGRVARRQKNVDAVLDVVIELFAEESLFPTIEQAATRSGLSLRSLYRYFADPGELLEATIVRSRVVAVEASRLHSIGTGPLADRIRDFVAMRLAVYSEAGSVYRATVANAGRHPRIQDELTRNRDEMREQFELQFAPELSALSSTARADVINAGDLLTQLSSIDHLRRHRKLSAKKAASALESTLLTMLGPSR